ncbi:MAG TPA: polysaccharide deacetylase family protein [Flavipsychrobacter sp.]|nr:polysaccharide deacetylase family protein [Flavipsychrobacter sp.]
MRITPFKIVNILSIVALIVLVWLYQNIQVSGWWFLALFLVYSSALVLGAIYIRWNFYLKSFDKGENKNWIALTFDDGPAGKTAAILDILKNENVPATFFCIGKNVSDNSELVKRWDDEGHLIGNHSFNHGFNFDWQSAKQMAEEIEQTNATIRSIIGKSPAFFRPPYGVTNPNVAKAVKLTQVHSIAWNVRSFDTTAKNPDQLLARILNQLRGGDIILLHDSMPITCEILTELIHKARQKGFTFVRVDKMLGLDAYA